MIFRHVDPYFAGASGAALVALGVSIFVLRDAFLDLKAVQAAKIGNGRLRIARTELRFEITRTVVVALLATTSISAAFTAAGIGRVLTWLELVPRTGMVLALAVIAIDAVSALRYRYWLRQTFHPEHPAAANVPATQTDEEPAR